MKKIFVLIVMILSFSSICFANENVEYGIHMNIMPNAEFTIVRDENNVVAYVVNTTKTNGVKRITFEENAIKNPKNGDVGNIYIVNEVYIANNDGVVAWDIPCKVVITYFKGFVDDYAYMEYVFPNNVVKKHLCGLLGQAEFDLVNAVRQIAEKV
jgi:hypothetical protein